MCIVYAWPRSVQGQGHNLRLNIVWLYFVSWNVSYDEMMCSAYVWPRLVQGQGKKLTLLPMLHMGYSSTSVIALDYDFTFLYKKNWFHPVTHRGRDDCFHFRKHPSSSSLVLAVFLFVESSKTILDSWLDVIFFLLCSDVHEAQQCLSHAGVPRLVPPLPWWRVSCDLWPCCQGHTYAVCCKVKQWRSSQEW